MENREPLTLEKLEELVKYHSRSRFDDFLVNVYSRHETYVAE